jgi:hypothetical protein
MLLRSRVPYELKVGGVRLAIQWPCNQTVNGMACAPPMNLSPVKKKANCFYVGSFCQAFLNILFKSL